MKILELCSYSAGICGVWTRVREESERLAKKGHTVRIFSSNISKGSNELAPSEGFAGKARITRFPAKKLGGESFMSWDFEKEALEYAPDVIIAHAYRHTHTTKALKFAEKLKESGKECKVFLVTHAPFDRSASRSLPAKIAVWYYDHFIGPKTINKFTKVITITKWEVPYLVKIGIDEHNIEYIPNGIPKEFFTQKKAKERNKIMFLGRISPIKSIETLIEAVPYLEDKEIDVEIVGPAEEEYLRQLKELIANIGIGDRVSFSPAIYDVSEKIEKVDTAKIFVLPSKSEGMPQSLVEAMARGKIVIGSSNPGAKDLIEDGRNGYLFKIGDSKELAEKINFALKSGDIVRKQAREDVERFAWEKIIEKWEELLQ